MPHPDYKSSAASHLTFGSATLRFPTFDCPSVCLELRPSLHHFPTFALLCLPTFDSTITFPRTLSCLSTARLPRPSQSPPYTLFRPVALPSSFRFLSSLTPSPTLTTAFLLQPRPQVSNNFSDLLAGRESPLFYPCGCQIMSRADDDHSSSAANSVSPTVCRVANVAVQLIRFPEIQSMHRSLLPACDVCSSLPLPSRTAARSNAG